MYLKKAFKAPIFLTHVIKWFVLANYIGIYFNTFVEDNIVILQTEATTDLFTELRSTCGYLYSDVCIITYSTECIKIYIYLPHVTDKEQAKSY